MAWITCEVNFREVYRARQHISDESSCLSPGTALIGFQEVLTPMNLVIKTLFSLDEGNVLIPSFSLETPKLTTGEKKIYKIHANSA